MSEVVLTEQLDQAIEAMLRNPDAPLAGTDPQVAELVGIALELRALPRADFKARLKNELEQEAAMSETRDETESGSPHSKAESVRATFRTVTPYLTVADVHDEIEFVTKAFGAEGKIYGLGSAGGYHSEYKIGDSMIMIGGGGEGAKWKSAAAPAVLHPSVEEVYAVYQHALRAGPTSPYSPTAQDA